MRVLRIDPVATRGVQLEASALQHAGRRGLLARRSPLLKLQGDEKLIAMVRDGNAGAFEVIIDRYQSRLLGFCRQMLHSTEDAEDVLQEVFVNAYRAMLADTREINLRPWLYRIARNRCLNHLRKPTADAKESMDDVPVVEAASTAERVHNREEFRQLLGDVQKLPETQRTALLLREIDAMSYDDIARTMDTTVASVKSLLVRARISLAEASKARLLTCGEVRLELAEAAEGLGKASGEIRRHVRDCPECEDFRKQLRSDGKVLAALSPIGPLIAFKAFIGSKLGFGGGAGASSTAGGGAGAAAGAAGGAGAAGAGTIAAGGALAGGGTAGGLGFLGSAVGAKAVAGVAAAAVLTAGAVEVQRTVVADPSPSPAIARVLPQPAKPDIAPAVATQAPVDVADVVIEAPAPTEVVDPAPVVEPEPAPVVVPPVVEEPVVEPLPETEVAPVESVDPSVTEEPAEEEVTVTTTVHATGGTGVVAVGNPTPPAPAPAPAPAPTPAPTPAPQVQAPLPPVVTPVP